MGPCIANIFQYIYIQQDATLHSLFISVNCSTCFGWYHHPSLGAHTTVSTAPGIFHTVTATCRYHGRVGTINSPDDGHVDARNMQRIEIKHIWKRIVCQVGYLQGSVERVRGHCLMDLIEEVTLISRHFYSGQPGDGFAKKPKHVARFVNKKLFINKIRFYRVTSNFGPNRSSVTFHGSKMLPH